MKNHTNSRPAAKVLRAATIVGLAAALTMGTAAAGATAAAQTPNQPTAAATTGSAGASEEDYRQARSALQQALRDADQTVVAQRAGASLGSRFGQAVFRGVAQSGSAWALDEVLRELGYGDDIAGDLASINAAIEALTEQVQQIHENIEKLLDEADRSEYRAAYRTSQEYANDIDLAALLVNGWLQDGVTPSDTLMEQLTLVLTSAVTQLQDNLNNPTSGTIPWMMRAAERSAASDLQHYWADIDSARDDYRAALAQALATLQVMTDWDTEDGMVRSALTSVTPVAKNAVLRTYQAGIGYPQDTQNRSRYVHVLDQDFVTANRNYGTSPPPPPCLPFIGCLPFPFQADDWQDVPTTKADLEPWLQAMAARYVPATEDGPQTLEELLSASGIPTRYDFADTYHMNYRVVPGSPWSIGYSETTITSTEGYIDGNNYRTRKLTHVNKARDWSRYGSEQRRDELSAQALKPRVKQSPVSLSDAGRAANLDPELAREVAFGQAD